MKQSTTKSFYSNAKTNSMSIRSCRRNHIWYVNNNNIAHSYLERKGLIHFGAKKYLTHQKLLFKGLLLPSLARHLSPTSPLVKPPEKVLAYFSIWQNLVSSCCFILELSICILMIHLILSRQAGEYYNNTLVIVGNFCPLYNSIWIFKMFPFCNLHFSIFAEFFAQILSSFCPSSHF